MFSKTNFNGREFGFGSLVWMFIGWLDYIRYWVRSWRGTGVNDRVFRESKKLSSANYTDSWKWNFILPFPTRRGRIWLRNQCARLTDLPDCEQPLMSSFVLVWLVAVLSCVENCRKLWLYNFAWLSKLGNWVRLTMYVCLTLEMLTCCIPEDTVNWWNFKRRKASGVMSILMFCSS